MPELIWDSPGGTKWVPSLDRIMVSDEPYLKGPMAIGHEIGHWKYDQTLGDTDPLLDMCQERDAWRFALDKLPPDEIDLGFLKYTLEGYLLEVEDWYGKGPELDMARGLKNEIMDLARRRKGDY
jgi:hypothetical protein